MQEWKAMLLAAGEGKRLGSLTSDCPKPMIRVGSAPILEHNIRLLRRHGIADIAINLHHRPDSIQEYFGDGSRFGVRINYSYEEELLGTAGAVSKLRAYFDRRFFVLYGDNLTDCDLSKLAGQHVATEALCTIALFHRDDVQASGVADVDSEGRIRQFVEKPAPGAEPSHWVSAGVICFEPESLGYIPQSGASDFGRDVIPDMLRSGGNVRGYFMTETLFWIDSPEDHHRTQQMVLEGDRRTDFLRF